MDVLWWQRFLPQYNGVSIIMQADWSAPDAEVACDACLEGAGGWFQGRYFHSEFPEFIKVQGLHINGLEMLTMLVALKLWGKFLKGKRIIMLCDNLSSVVVMQTGKARDRFLQACLRELVMVQAIWEFELKVQHIRGTENRIPDLLSHWGLGLEYRRQFTEMCKGVQVQETFVHDSLFQLTHDW